MTPETIRQGIERLKKRLEEVNAFDPTSVTEQNNIPRVEALGAAVDDSIVRTFGADTPDYKRYSDAAYFNNGPFNYMHDVPIGQVQESLVRSKASSIALLTQATTSLEERLADFRGATLSQTVPTPQVVERKVFVVHGHDEGAREAGGSATICR